MSLPAHIQKARESGPAAGMRAYLRTHAPTSAERRADILEADDKLVRYCEIFGDQIGLNASAPATAARATVDAEDKGTLYERFLAFLKAEDEPGASIQVVEDEPTPAPASPRKPAQPKAPVAKGDVLLYDTADGSRTIELTVTGFGKTKQNRPGVLLRNGNTGRVKAWTVKSVARHIENGRIVVL